MARFLSLFLISFLMPVQAAETAPPELSVVQVLLPLFMVVCLIFALAWLLKKMNVGTPTIGREITVVANTPVSPQARVCLIRVGGKDILFGVTPQQIEHLHTFDEPVSNTDLPENSQDFSEQFKKLLKR